MINLKNVLSVWNTSEFERTLKHELEKLGLDQLPLQQGLSSSSVALDNSINVLILSSSGTTDTISIKAGIFYSGIIAGCNCADDPTPMEEQNEYCEILVYINRSNGEARITLLPD